MSVSGKNHHTVFQKERVCISGKVIKNRFSSVHYCVTVTCIIAFWLYWSVAVMTAVPGPTGRTTR